jgi:hypothetical protein
MIPVPNHLRTCTVPVDNEADEFQYVGKVKCACGGTAFQMLHTNATHEWEGEQVPCVAEIDGKFFLRIAAKCEQCGTEHLLLDSDFHGWNGFVCHDKKKAKQPRPPLVAWGCRQCAKMSFESQVTISSEGEVDAIEEADGDLDETNWQEGFSWIDIDVRCCDCGDEHEGWISYETM